MKAANLKFSLVDTYLRLLNNLSPDTKREIISKLSDSLKGPKDPSDKSIRDLFGAFVSKSSADEILADLKANRNFNTST